MELKGRVVLVTGAARRVGRAVALRLAQAGCDLAVHYRRSAAEAAETVSACRAHGVAAEVFEDPGDDSRSLDAGYDAQAATVLLAGLDTVN